MLAIEGSEKIGIDSMLFICLLEGHPEFSNTG